MAVHLPSFAPNDNALSVKAVAPRLSCPKYLPSCCYSSLNITNIHEGRASNHHAKSHTEICTFFDFCHPSDGVQLALLTQSKQIGPVTYDNGNCSKCGRYISRSSDFARHAITHMELGDKDAS